MRLSRLRLISIALVAAVAAATFGGTTPASGQTVEDKRDEARQVAAQLDDLTTTYARLADRSNAAQAELTEVEDGIAQAQARLDNTIAERDERRGDLADYAVQAYLSGPDDSALTIAMDSRDEREMPVRLGYQDAVAGNQNQLIDDLAATEEDVADRVADLEVSQQDAQGLADEIARSADDAQAAIDEQEALQAQVDDELQGLIDEQRAQEAAERQAAFEAAAAAQAAATPSTDPSDNGGTTPTGGGTAPPSPSPSPTPTPPPPASGAQGAVDAAMSQVGVRYTWGGDSPEEGFDCSGLMLWAWARAGRSLPHQSGAQYSATRRVSAGDLQPGDLVFYGAPVGGIHHVAMYIGGGNVVDALNSGTRVGVRSIGWAGTPSAYGRP